MNELSKNIPAVEYFDDNETINFLTNQIINNINAFVFISVFFARLSSHPVFLKLSLHI